MSTSLRDFLKQRETELRLEMSRLNAELNEIRAAREAIDNPSGPRSSVPAAVGKPTHRDMIIEILDERPEGAGADQIRSLLQKRFGVELPRPSVSSKLSRMKSDGLIQLDADTKVWRSPKHPSDGSPLFENGDVAASPEAEAGSADDAPGPLKLQPSPDGA